MYSTAFWYLFIVFWCFWPYCVTTVTPFHLFYERSNSGYAIKPKTPVKRQTDTKIQGNTFFLHFFFIFFNYYLLTFCSRSQITWGDFFAFSIILIEQFCSCYTEPHLSFTCSPSWTTGRAKFLTYLRPIGLETLPAYFAENFVFSAF